MGIQRFRRTIAKATAALASLVVFFTVYALILPAATITQDDASQDEGIYLEEALEDNDEPGTEGTEPDYEPDAEGEEPGGDSEGLEDGDNPASGQDADDQEEKGEGDDGSPAEAAEPNEAADTEDEPTAKPAQSFNRRLALKDESTLTVKVQAENGSFPDDVGMKVEELDGSGIDDAVKAKALEQKVVSEDDVADGSVSVTAITISFFDEQEQGIQPEQPVRVSLSAKSDDSQQVIGMYRVDDELNVDPVESDESSAGESLFAFDESKFCSYAILWESNGQSAKEEREPDAENDEAKDGKEGGKADVPNTLSAKGDDYQIVISYGDEAEIPETAQLAIKELKAGSDSYNSHLEMAAEAAELESPDDITFARFFDIDIIDDGKAIEPAAPVEVSITYDDALDLGVGDELSVVHFAKDDTEVITDIVLEDSCSKITYQQESFSVTGTIISGNPTAGQKYLVLVKYEGEYYMVNNDGTLAPAQYNAQDNTATVDFAMMWTYGQSSGRTYLRHESEAKTYSAQVPSSYYYRYIDPSQPDGVSTEDASHPNLLNQAAINYNGRRISSSNANSFIGVENDNGVLRISGGKDSANAVEVLFANISTSTIPNVHPNNHTVSHIDISINGTSRVNVPLASGSYYDSNGNELFTVSTANGKTLSLSEEVVITIDDIKRATITAYTKDGDTETPVDNAFYVTGYSRNQETQYSSDQVRIEGSFKVANLQPGNNNDPNVMRNRLQNRIYYNVSTTKQVTFDLVDEQGRQLYDANGTKLTVSVDVTLTASFDYWDERNECPPLQNWKDEWRRGKIYDWFGQYVSGMDFVLGGDAEASGSKIVVAQITKIVTDEQGNTINPSSSYESVFNVFSDPDGDPSSVRDLNVGSYTQPADYSGYAPKNSRSVSVGSSGMGLIYDYDVPAGMVYVQEDKDSIPDSVVDANGETWIYKGTRIETEYVERGNEHDGQHHVSDMYTKASGSYNSIPEVLGDYVGDDGGKRRNGSLDFYVYNIYEPDTTQLEVEKKWVGGTVPPDASVTLTLKRYKLVPEGGVNPPSPGEGTLIISDSYTGLDDDVTYFASYRVTGPNGYDKTFAGSGETITINDLAPGNYVVQKTVHVPEGYTVDHTFLTSGELSIADDTITEFYFTPSVFTKQGDAPTGKMNLTVVFIADQDTYPNARIHPYNFTLANANWENDYSVNEQPTLSEPGESWTVNGLDAFDQSGNALRYRFNVNPNNVVITSVTGTDGLQVSYVDGVARIIAKPGDYTIYVNGGTTVPSRSYGAPSAAKRNATAALGTRASLSVSNQGALPTVEGYTFELDDAWSQTVTLPDDGSWAKVVDGLERSDSQGTLYAYFIAQMDETGVPDGTVANIDVNDDGTMMLVFGDHEGAGAFGDNAKVSATNTLNLKVDIGLVKVDKESNAPLSGAKFTITRYDAIGGSIIGEPVEYEVGEDGQLTFEGLGVGFYKLEETLTPDGYILTSEAPFFEVKQDPQTGGLYVEFADTGLITYSPSNMQFTVRNEPGASLPNTGGPGSGPVRLTGAVLAAIAAALAAIRRGRRSTTW